MARLTPSTLQSTYAAIEALNSNFADIAALMERVVFRDGTSPNSMLANLDLNHFRLENVGDAVANSDAPNYGQVLNLISEAASDASAVVLEAELASTSGAGMIGTADAGVTVQEALDALEGASPASPLTNYSPREIAYSHNRAREMAADLTDMVGFAQYVGVTGGTGQTEYLVTNDSDDEGIEGSFRWAVTQAIAGGGGLIIFDPTRKFDIVLTKVLIVGASALSGTSKILRNITIDAPGRNVTIWNRPTVEGVRLSGKNIIYRRIKHETLAEDYEDTEERDSFSINPIYSENVWVHQCTFTHSADGVTDAASSGLTTTMETLNFTISNCIIRNQDKCMAIGQSGTFTSDLTTTPRINVTLYKNYFDHCGQRQPRVSNLAFADVVNCVMDFAPVYRVHTAVAGGISGVNSTFGGKVSVRNCLFRAKVGSGYSGVMVDAESAVQTSGCVAENGITIAADQNTANIPAIPYTLVADTIDADTAAWADEIFALAGAGQYPEPEGLYKHVVGVAPEDPDGVVLRLTDTGYYVRVEPRGSAASAQTTSFVLTRTNAEIVSGAFEVTGSGFFSVGTEGNAATDDLETISGGTNGMVIGLRTQSDAEVITVKNTGNIYCLDNILLDDNIKTLWLYYDSGVSGWLVLSEPERLESGPYTATATASANCSGVSMDNFLYSRNGKVVTCSARINLTATTLNVLTTLYVSLPVVSDLTSDNDLIGTGSTNASTREPVFVSADTTNNRALVSFYPTASASAHELFVSFQYEVK